MLAPVTVTTYWGAGGLYTGSGDRTTSAMNAVAGGRRAATTLMDQAFSSASNFAVGVAVARVAGAAGLGAFAFAYVGWVVLVRHAPGSDHGSDDIEGDARRNGNPTIERGFAAEVLLGSAAAAVFALLGGVLLLFHAHSSRRRHCSSLPGCRRSSYRTIGATWPL